MYDRPRRHESRFAPHDALCPTQVDRSPIADGGEPRPANGATDDATERRKLRPREDEGSGSFGRHVFHGFWEVMILALPAHLYLLAFTGDPVAERTAATFAYPAVVLAVGALRGGHVSVGRPWPGHLGWGVPARLVCYNLGIVAGVELGMLAVLGVHWTVGAVVAAVVPAVVVAGVPALAALAGRLARGSEPRGR